MSHSTFNKTTRSGGFFITGTDTDVGKTYTSGCLAMTLAQQGLTVSPRKPIASGCIRQTDGSLLSEDALFLQRATQTDERLEHICPFQFEAPLSPHTAIKQAKLTINIEDLVTACAVPKNRFALVEGAGGFYSPLALDGLNKDLAIALGYPVILVVANRLGCINQTLLSIAAIEQAGLQLHSVIINQVHATRTPKATAYSPSSAEASTLATHQQPVSAPSSNYALGLEDFTSARIFNVDYAEDTQVRAIEGWTIKG